MEASVNVFHDRRSQRSNSRREALTLQLRESAKRAGVHSMVLADHLGRVIARSDRDAIADELASFSPFLAKPKTFFGQIQLAGDSHNVAVSRFKLGKTNAYLCAVGAEKRGFGGIVLQTTAGVRRIMNG